MTVERDAATQLPSALMLKARGLERAQPILSGIRAHPFNGITNFINGNGLATERRYDSAGRLTALVTNGLLDFRYDYPVGPRIAQSGMVPTPNTPRPLSPCLTTMASAH